jgi:hypothetical protein
MARRKEWTWCWTIDEEWVAPTNHRWSRSVEWVDSERIFQGALTERTCESPHWCDVSLSQCRNVYGQFSSLSLEEIRLWKKTRFAETLIPLMRRDRCSIDDLLHLWKTIGWKSLGKNVCQRRLDDIPLMMIVLFMGGDGERVRVLESLIRFSSIDSLDRCGWRISTEAWRSEPQYSKISRHHRLYSVERWSECIQSSVLSPLKNLSRAVFV